MLEPQASSEPNELKKLGLPTPLIQLLAARGFSDVESIQGLVSPSLKDLRDPFTLKEMPAAIERLIKARENQEEVLVYGDFDMDGTPGVALLISGLEMLGFEKLHYFQPKRLSDGYGLHYKPTKKFVDKGVGLVLTVDVGITATETVAKLKADGVDVIITDHHLPGETLPEAVAVVNPNQPDCPSGLGHLCGTGVAFYLLLALRRSLQEQGFSTENFQPKKLLDCFAIATLADMVPLIKENRVLAKHGMLQLSQTDRPGIYQLLDRLDLLDHPLSGDDVVFKLVPKLNALSRLDRDLLPLDLFLAKDAVEAESMVDETLRTHKERVSLQKSANDEADAYLATQPADEKFNWVWSRQIHQGVVGLIATRLANETGKPTFVGAAHPDGRIVGSSRLPSSSSINLVEVLKSTGDALHHSGGHAPAAGFELSEATTELFRERLRDYFNNPELPKEAQTADWQFDSELQLEELNAHFMKWLSALGPFGCDYEKPVFQVRAELRSVRELKGGHLKFEFGEPGMIQKFGAIWFSPAPSHALSVKKPEVGDVLEALCEPQWNYFRGKASIQLMIHDLRRTEIDAG